MKKLFLLLAFLFALTASAYSTDVQIGPSTIPGFNAANLPADVTVSPVTVTFNSPTVTCANCLRQQWVGLGGFRIQINGVTYTVAYVSSRSALTLTTSYAAGDSSAATILWHKYVELRVYADSAFQPLGKTYIVQPGAPGSGAWHRRVVASVVNELGTNNLHIPQLTLDATTDSPTNQAARYYAAFYRPEGSFIQTYDCFDSFALPPTGASTWPDVCVFNQRQVIVQDDSTYTKTQIDSFRTGCTSGQMLFYAVTGLKPACLNVGTGLQIVGDTISTTAGSSYTTILEDATPLAQRLFLNFGAGLLATDDAGNGRTNVAIDSSVATLTGSQTLTNKTLTSPRIGTAILDTNGNEVLETPATANAVNQARITNSATGNPVQFSVVGDDANISGSFVTKGNGDFFLITNNIIRLALSGNTPTAFFGDGIASSTPDDFTINGTGGSGTNIAGANLDLAGGKGTGNAVSGQVAVRYPLIGASGTTLQSLSAERFPVSSSLYTNTTIGTTIANTTTEISVFTGATASSGSTALIQAGSARAGTVYRLRLYLLFSTTGTPTIQFRLKLGSITVCDSAPFNAPTGAASGLAYIDVYVFVNTLGSSGLVRGQMEGRIHSGLSGAVTPTFFSGPAGEATIDFTVNQQIDFTAQWGTASASNSMQLLSAYIDRIR